MPASYQNLKKSRNSGDFVIRQRQGNDLVKRIQKGFGTKVHPRSIERALLRHQKKTPLSGASDRPPSRHDLAVRYEQLRHDAIGRPTYDGEGLGLALFLRRGMTAWMQAWPECAGHAEHHPTRTQSGSSETITADMRAQITTLLAGIILSLQQEAIP